MLGYLIVGLAGLIVGTLFGVAVGENSEKDKRIKYLEEKINYDPNQYVTMLEEKDDE